MSARVPTVAVLTQGCKVNQYESEAIAEALERAGFCVLDGDACCDAYVVNTCTVTGEADRKARQLIRHLHTKNPRARILVTGCFAQSDPSSAATIPGVSAVCGNADKLAVVELARRLLSDAAGAPEAPILSVRTLEGAPFEPMRITRFNRTRAYVKIEDGCENHCTYCAIPAARGRVRSKEPGAVLEEVRGLVAGGCCEVVLTGIETASFGRDLEGFTLADLLEEVDRIPGIGRIRLGSLDPSVLRPELVQRIAALRALAPHFHLSVQSGSSAVLAAMHRKYNREQLLAGIRRLREAIPEVQLSADLIVGFPGETERDFEDTCTLAREAQLLHMHVFAYSKRRGTPAASLPGQIPPEVKRQRSAALIALGEELRHAQLTAALSRPTREVLFESHDGGLAIGHTPDFLEVAVPSAVSLHSELHTVTLRSVAGDRLLAELKD